MKITLRYEKGSIEKCPEYSTNPVGSTRVFITVDGKEADEAAFYNIKSGEFTCAGCLIEVAHNEDFFLESLNMYFSYLRQ